MECDRNLCYTALQNDLSCAECKAMHSSKYYDDHEKRKEMKDLREIRNNILWMYNAISLLIDAIDDDKLSEVKKQYWQIVDRRDCDTWDFEESIITHIERIIGDILYWDQNEDDEHDED